MTFLFPLLQLSARLEKAAAGTAWSCKLGWMTSVRPTISSQLQTTTQQTVRFMELFGHPFGLASAVLNYNRGPELQVAVARQLLAAPTVHFYDDNLTFGLNCEKGSAQISFKALCELLGVELDPDKHARMSSAFVYTGAAFDMSSAISLGVVTVSPKPGRVDGIQELLRTALRRNQLTPAAASSLRGKSVFLSSQIHGRVQRFCEGALAERQYQRSKSGHALSLPLRQALEFLDAVLSAFQPRCVTFNEPKPPTLIYTDAVFTPGQPVGLSCVIFAPQLRKPQGLYAKLPDSLMEQFRRRETHISQAEIAAVLLAAIHEPECLRQKDVIHFIDNSSALSGLIKGHSSQNDSSALLSIFAVITASLCARFWHEFVESSANVADGLSRNGLPDALMGRLQADLREVAFPQVPDLYKAPFACLLQNFTNSPSMSLKPCSLD